MIYGYARVSALDQSTSTQIEQLKKYGVDSIIEEKISGIAANKLLDELIQKLQEGDTLVATRMDRLGRNAAQLIPLIESLEKRNINLVILDLNVDTKTPTGKFFMQVMAAFAELERTNLKIKQRAGIDLAKKNGLHLGRPRKYTDKHIGLQHAVELYKSGDFTVNEICEICKVSRATFYRHLKKIEF